MSTAAVVPPRAAAPGGPEISDCHCGKKSQPPRRRYGPPEELRYVVPPEKLRYLVSPEIVETGTPFRADFQHIAPAIPRQYSMDDGIPSVPPQWVPRIRG